MSTSLQFCHQGEGEESSRVRRAEIHLKTRRRWSRKMMRLVNMMVEVESGNMSSVMVMSLSGSRYRSKRQGGWIKLDITRPVADTGKKDWR